LREEGRLRVFENIWTSEGPVKRESRKIYNEEFKSMPHQILFG